MATRIRSALPYHHQCQPGGGRQLQRGADPRGRREPWERYAIKQGTLALSTNYALTYVGADLTITARPITVTADAKTKVYGTPIRPYAITPVAAWWRATASAGR